MLAQYENNYNRNDIATTMRGQQFGDPDTRNFLWINKIVSFSWKNLWTHCVYRLNAVRPSGGAHVWNTYEIKYNYRPVIALEQVEKEQQNLF